MALYLHEVVNPAVTYASAAMVPICVYMELAVLNGVKPTLRAMFECVTEHYREQQNPSPFVTQEQLLDYLCDNFPSYFFMLD